MSHVDKPTPGIAANDEKYGLVLGVGNVLLKDEGVGVHVVERLRHAATPLPPHIEIIDGGTMGMELLLYFEGKQKAIIVDVVDAGVEAGTIFRFTPGDIPLLKNRKTLSFHQLGLLDALQMARAMGQDLPEIVFIAIQPKDISPGTEMSPEIEDKIPTLIEMVVKEFPTCEWE